MAIKRKISLGFVVIATILLVSSAISIYEFIKMRSTVSNLINDNISAINTTRLLLDVTDEYNFNLLEGIGDETRELLVLDADDDMFSSNLKGLRESFTTEQERMYADSVLFAYTAYVIVMKDAQEVWQSDYTGRRAWYFSKLHPVYMRLRWYLQKLTLTSQEALAENSMNMSDSFYRSIMPGVVTVLMGMVMVFLFNYFINFYFVNPLMRISRGVSDYLFRKKSYNVVVENDDELKDLNENVRELVETNRKLSKHS
ncbi:MAG: MCP four helix bundle domain-containing protein [Bacteroidales bacterium]|nr:MCP four helix bundle domain-containing protein [Bacteroidales bacterium]